MEQFVPYLFGANCGLWVAIITILAVDAWRKRSKKGRA